MEAKWGLICRYAEINDAEGFVMKGEFSSGGATSFPYTPPRFYHAARLSGDEGKTYLVGSRIVSPSGEVILLDEGESMTAEGDFIAFIRGYDSIEFPIPGDYSIDILINSEPVHGITLTLYKK